MYMLSLHDVQEKCHSRNRANYTKASTHMLEKVFSPTLSYISSDGKEWVCKTCDRTLKRGNMPLKAKANGLQLLQCFGTEIDLPTSAFYENGCIAFWETTVDTWTTCECAFQS